MNKSILLKITIAFFAIIFSFNVKAQGPTFQWADQFTGSNSLNYMSQVINDNLGNSYIIGSIDGGGAIDLDPGVGVSNFVTSGLNDIFFGKYSSTGNLIWAYKLGSTQDDVGLDIALDNSGNVFITGYFSSTIDFDPSAGVANMTNSSGGKDIFVAKYSNSGSYLTSMTIPTFGSGGVRMTVDNNDDIIISGDYSNNPTDFNPGVGVFNLIANVNDGFIAKYTNTLLFVWAGRLDATSIGASRVLVDSSNRIYLAGIFSGGADLDPSAGTFNISTPAGTAIFIAKYNSNGTFAWGKVLNASSSSSYADVVDMEIDNSANLYIGGSINQYTVDFDPGPGTYNLIGSSYDPCLAKYDSSGTFNWAIKFGGVGASERIHGVGLDVNNNPVVVGMFNIGADFDPGPGTATLTASSSSAPSAFVGKYSNSTGAYLWAFSLYAFGGGSNAYCCDVSSSNGIHVFGDFNQTVDFDPSAASLNLTSTPFASQSNMYLAKYDAGCTSAPLQPVSILGSTSICSGSSNTYSVSAVAGATSYTWSLPGGWSGTSTTNSISITASATSGNITVTANNGCGNSSAQTLSVTVNTIPATPSSISGTTTICSGSSNTYSVSAVAGATSYTWSLPGGWSGTSTTNSISTTASATSGNITVTANNTCGNSSASTLAITVNTIPATPGTISGLASMCIGTGAQTYSITAIGGATSYTWTLPATWSGTSTTNSIVATPGTNGGNITVTANNTCGNSSPQTLAVIINPLPVVTYSQSPALVCVNATSVSLGTASPTGGTFTGTSVTGSTFNASTAGTGTYNITYTYTDGNGCVNFAISTIVVDPCTGISQNTFDSEITIYPNPATSTITLSGIADAATIEVYNVLGKIVLSQQITNDKTEIDLSKETNGIYFIKISSDTGTSTKRIIKQ